MNVIENKKLSRGELIEFLRASKKNSGGFITDVFFDRCVFTDMPKGIFGAIIFYPPKNKKRGYGEFLGFKIKRVAFQNCVCCI